VQNSQTKKVIIAALLATLGIIVYVALQQHTYQAKLEAELNSKKTQVQSQIKELNTKNNLTTEQQKQIEQLNKEKEELNKQLQAKRNSATAYAEALQAAYVPPSGSHTDWMAQAGIPSSQWGCTDYIISHESGWRVNAYNPSGGATGLPQALPGSKMASAGADWQTNPVTQLKWYYGYVTARYGSPCGAYNFWQVHHWY
jgi:hypothetical protein